MKAPKNVSPIGPTRGKHSAQATFEAFVCSFLPHGCAHPIVLLACNNSETLRRERDKDNEFIFFWGGVPPG